MQLILAILVILGVVALWYWRVKAAREGSGAAFDPGGDVRLSARRVMFKRRSHTHPADAVDDPRLAAAGIIVAVATMDAPITQAEIKRLTRSAQETFDVTEREALDIVSFGRWIAGQCASNAEAVRRLSGAVMKLAGSDAGPDLLRMIEEVATAGGGALGEEERDALDTVRNTLGMSGVR